MRVVCIGDVMVDVVAQLPTELAPGSDTPAAVTLVGGGSAANTAAWLVEAGMATTFVGRVGDDPLGRKALDELAAQGIDLEVSVDPDRPTGICIVLVDIDGERTMVPSVGANAGLGEAPPSASLFTADTHLHVSAYAVFVDGARPAVEAALSLASAAEATVSVDAASAAPLRTFGVDRFLDWLPQCALFANRDEAALLADTDDMDVAVRALGARCGEAIVKLGRRGALWSDGSSVARDRPAALGVLDSTGAGDAFAAGVLAARLSGADVRVALRAGSALAARAIAIPGARPLRQPE